MAATKNYEDPVTESFIQVDLTREADSCVYCMENIQTAVHFHVCFRSEGKKPVIRRFCTKDCIEQYFEEAMHEMRVAAFALTHYRDIS